MCSTSLGRLRVPFRIMREGTNFGRVSRTVSLIYVVGNDADYSGSLLTEGKREME